MGSFKTSDTHTVSLLRRPSIRGRVGMVLAIILAAGPGGTLLFRVTQSLFAADAADVGENVMTLDAKSDVEKRTPAHTGNTSNRHRAGASQTVELQSAPQWDLTQQANDAWMIVDRSAEDDLSAASDDSPASPPKKGPGPESPARPAGDSIQLMSDTNALTLIEPGAKSSDDIPPPPRPKNQAAVEAPRITPRTAPQPADLIEVRKNWQGWDEQYFVDTALAPRESEAAQAESQLTPSEARPAPVAPPADSESPPQALTEDAIPEADVPAGPAVPHGGFLQNDHLPDTADGSRGRSVQNKPAVPVPLITETDGDAVPLHEQSHPAQPMAEIPCQTCGNGPRPICGLHCNGETCGQDLQWSDSWLIPWEVFAQGEYIGPARLPHVPEYRLRVDDQIEFVYRLTREKSAEPYLINTGDTLRIASLTSETLNVDALVQPDGTISLPSLGQVLVAGRSIAEVRADLEARYEEHIRNPAITVTPVELNSVLEELRATVDNRFGNGGQSRFANVTPEGTVQLPAIGSVPAHGLTLDELAAEIQYRYDAIVHGLEVTPILAQRAPRYVYVLGEVRSPGRFTLEGPTTLTQAIALAGGWNVGANLTQVIVFRRDESWRLMATKVGLKRSLYGKDPCPDGELWIRDSDIVVVPKSPILVIDEIIELVFTRGVYGVVPFSTNLSYVRDLTDAAGGTVVPIP